MRNSYSAGNALRRVEQLPRALGMLLDGWPFLALLCAVAAALALLGFARSGYGLAVFCAVVAGVVSGVVLVRGSGGLVRAASTGPITTLAGSAVILATVITLLSRVRRRLR